MRKMVAVFITRNVHVFLCVILLSGLSFCLGSVGDSHYEVTGGGMILRLDAEGRIEGVVIGADKKCFALKGWGGLHQGHRIGSTQVLKLSGGGMQFKRIVVLMNNKKCTVRESFIPTKDSIRWEVDVHSKEAPWSEAVIAGLQWPVGKNTRFWTSWSDPEMIGAGGWDLSAIKAEGWRDPLESRSFANSSRWYGGNPAMMVPSSGDYFSIPLCSVLEPKAGVGLSLVQSPEDILLYMKLTTDSNGKMDFEHLHHRLGADKHVRFSMDLVSHAADWRCGLSWMVERYPEYFNPVNPKALDIAGCGAYSSWEGELEAEKLNKMAFRFNWKASFDFPYMGMFLPPVETWRTFATYEEATKDPWVTTPYKGRITSLKEMQDYCRLINNYGFYVLSYFNVTEFGTKIKGPEAVKQEVPEAEIWKNSTDFLHTKIADGILYDNEGEYYRTWGDAIVMDCGAEGYQGFLLAQAGRHIEKLPASSGVCIDRLDWLRFFNSRADDGVSWYNKKCARSLINSWKDLMEKLGPLMHNHDKVIYVNPMVLMRIDMLRQADGIYSEHNEMGPALNASALLGVRMPVIAWTWNEDSLRPDPDIFFQRLIYLGVFPTAPVPYNNHTILPSEFADKWYLDYGPLLKELSGRKWVLMPKVIEVVDSAAKANIFAVGGGYSMPVVLGDAGITKATVVLNTGQLELPEDFTVDALHPGMDEPAAVEAQVKNGKLELEVPLQRGCAVVRVKNK